MITHLLKYIFLFKLNYLFKTIHIKNFIKIINHFNLKLIILLLFI